MRLIEYLNETRRGKGVFFKAINHRSVIVSDNDQKLALKLASLEGLRRAN